MECTLIFGIWEGEQLANNILMYNFKIFAKMVSYYDFLWVGFPIVHISDIILLILFLKLSTNCPVLFHPLIPVSAVWYSFVETFRFYIWRVRCENSNSPFFRNLRQNMILKENFTLKTMVTLVFCENCSKNNKTHVLRVAVWWK